MSESVLRFYRLSWEPLRYQAIGSRHAFTLEKVYVGDGSGYYWHLYLGQQFYCRFRNLRKAKLWARDYEKGTAK